MNTSWTPEQRGATEQALWNASYGWDIKDREGLVEKLTDAVLVAVGPMIAAQAWQEGYWDGRRSTGLRAGVRYVNPYSEKEAGR